MRNIQLCQRAGVQFPCRPIGICSDYDNEISYIIDDTLCLYHFKPKSIDSDITVLKLQNRLQSEYQNVLTSPQVRLVEYLVESGCILLAIENGQVIIFNLRENYIDNVLKHPHNVYAFKFSPDQDLIALLDCNNELFVLSSDFEIQHKTNVILDNSSVNKPVGVGWGSKETQFFGLDGRPAKEAKTTKPICEDHLSSDVIETICSFDGYKKHFNQYRTLHDLDWHGDGRLLVTLTRLENEKHQIKVWNRNLELQFMSEQLYCMETGLISWIPNGQYICCAQQLTDGRQDITLFERNGLVHQRFSLPLKKSHLLIRQLSWSKDSKILAILGIEYTYNDRKIQSNWILMLYSCNNFHWYLKHVSYHGEDHSNLKICWSDSQSSEFILFSSDGLYRSYECSWLVTQAKQDSIVVVIDSDKLQLTPFNNCSVPPPFSAITVTMPEFISDIVLSNELSGLLITSNGNAISMHRKKNEHIEHGGIKIETKLSQAKHISLSLHFKIWTTVENIQSYNHWAFINDEDIIAIKHFSCKNPELFLIPLMDLNRATSKYVFPKCRITNISSDQSNNFAVVITNDGTIYRVDADETNQNAEIKVQLWTNEHGLKLSIPTIETASAISCCKVNCTPRVISVTRDMTLRADDRLITPNNCTSFAITKNYLIYTTVENLMRFQLFDNIYTEKTGDWTRNIESGAILISADEASAKVILQMPRGNLEIVYPRILLLHLLIKLLDCGKYIEALDMIRKHRINMNFIADYLQDFFEDPNKLNKFARTIGNHDVTWLNLFLSELNDEETTTSQYESIVSHLPVNIVKHRGYNFSIDRVNKICQNLSLHDDPKLLQPYLISLIKQSPPRIDLALQKVKSLKDESESGLKFLLYMVDIEKLFVEALGTYDSSIALMVANISNKDPKEYLSLINSFDAIENSQYRKYKIDSYIKRYDKAIVHLIDFFMIAKEQYVKEELLNMIVSKRLFKDFINYTMRSPVDDKVCKLVWLSYGHYLFEKRYYLESGIAYERADDYQSAIKSYLLDADWLRAMTVVAKMDKKEHLASYKMIAQYLIADSKFSEGANILENFCQDFNEAHQACIKGRLFCSANRIALNHKLDRSQLIEAILNFAVELNSTMYSSLQTNTIFFERLTQLRLDLEKQRSQSTGEGIILDCDTFSTIDGSDVSSQTSNTTRSGVSSLKTRKPTNSSKVTQRKKKINLKHGSRYEDLALLTELKNFIQSQDQYLIDSRSVCSSLCDLGLDVDNRKIITMLNDQVKNCYEFSKRVSDNIWPTDTLNLKPTNVYRIFLEKQNCPTYTIDASDTELLIKPKMPNFTQFIL